jgi:protein TonB
MLISKFDLYKREWLDLVFADRNQAYGAYDLRVHYGDNMLKALAMTIAGFTVGAIALTLVMQHKPTIVVDRIPHETTVPILPPVIAPKKADPVKQVHTKTVTPPAAPASTTPTKRFVEMAPTNDPVTTQPPTITELQHTAIGPVDSKGIDNGKTQNLPVSAGPGGPGGQGTSPTVDNGIHNGTEAGLDALPKPVGGDAAWSKFMNKNLRYPDTEAQGRVIISFVVEKDGHLTDITVLKGVSSELDQEALRVVKMAKAWIPGSQNGQPVRVRFTVPFVFQKSE